MGQTTRTVDLGSRRAMVLTLVVSALLLVAGLAILHSAGDLRLGPAPRHTATAPATTGPSASTSPTPASTGPSGG